MADLGSHISTLMSFRSDGIDAKVVRINDAILHRTVEEAVLGAFKAAWNL